MQTNVSVRVDLARGERFPDPRPISEPRGDVTVVAWVPGSYYATLHVGGGRVVAHPFKQLPSRITDHLVGALHNAADQYKRQGNQS